MCRAGLQIRVHGFKSRLHLGRLAQWERASLTRKRSLVQIQYRPLPFALTRALFPSDQVAACQMRAKFRTLAPSILCAARLTTTLPVVGRNAGKALQGRG